MSTKPARQGGVTLIELIMFIVIIGVALAGLLQVLNFTTKNSADPVRRKQALMVAESLLEEVRLAGFTYCDPTDPKTAQVASAAECDIKEAFGQGVGGEPVGTRPYDNINDYVDTPGVAKAAFNNAAGKLTDINGTVMDVEGYTATVTISPVELNGIGAAGISADTDVLRITVVVAYDDTTLALDAYRTRYAPLSP